MHLYFCQLAAIHGTNASVTPFTFSENAVISLNHSGTCNEVPPWCAAAHLQAEEGNCVLRVVCCIVSLFLAQTGPDLLYTTAICNYPVPVFVFCLLMVYLIAIFFFNHGVSPLCCLVALADTTTACNTPWMIELLICCGLVAQPTHTPAMPMLAILCTGYWG